MRFSALLLTLVLSVVQAEVVRADHLDPYVLLAAMVESAKSKSYQGLLLIQTPGKPVISMQLQHIAANSQAPEQEKLTALDGRLQEVVIDGSGMALYVAEGQDAELLRNPFIDTFVKDNTAFGSYVVSVVGEERVAGKQTVVLRIAAKDNWRYSYMLWLDKETFMYVKAQWFMQERLVSEATLYSVRPLEFMQTSFVAQAPSFTAVEKRIVAEESSRMKWLPEGFVLLSRAAYPPEGSGNAEHLVFGDGLSKISVYVGMAENMEVEDLSFGRTNMVSMPLGNDKKVIVLGEVPLRTIRKMAESIELL